MCTVLRKAGAWSIKQYLNINGSGVIDWRSCMVKEKCEQNVKIFLFGKHFFKEITVVNKKTVRADSRLILRNYCLRDMFQMELHFLCPGVRVTPGVFLDQGLNQSLLELSGFCQHTEPLAKTAYLIPCTILIRRQ